MRLCTLDELKDAFRLIISEAESERCAREFLVRHQMDSEGFLLVEPADWLPSVDEGSVADGTATTEGFVAFSRSRAEPSEPSTDILRETPTESVGESGEAISPPGWAVELRRWTDQRRSRLLIGDIMFTLDLLSVLSDDLARRVQLLLGLSGDEMEERRSQMRRGLEVLGWDR
jgi:hypothetical protein